MEKRRRTNNRKVIKYRRKPKAAAFIFAVVLIYVVCFVALYVTKAKVQKKEAEAPLNFYFSS